MLIGLLGGFTTFSSLGLESFALLRDGSALLALANLAGSCDGRPRRGGRSVHAGAGALGGGTMELHGDRLLLRIYIGESNRFGGVPLYEAIVQLARERGLSGATVLRGIVGFGANSRIHRASILRLSEDLPIVVEIVDRRERIEPFLVELDPMIEDGMVTLEEVQVLVYRPRREKDAPS